MRVKKWEFVWEFSQLSCPGQTRMRVDKREFAWEFSQLLCPCQTRVCEARVSIRVFLGVFHSFYVYLQCNTFLAHILQPCHHHRIQNPLMISTTIAASHPPRPTSSRSDQKQCLIKKNPLRRRGKPLNRLGILLSNWTKFFYTWECSSWKNWDEILSRVVQGLHITIVRVMLTFARWTQWIW